MPQFETLLQNATREKNRRSKDHTRDFWRSVVVDECRTSYAIVSYMARKRGADAMTPTHLRFEQIVISNKPTLGAAIRSLLEEMCEMEIRTGQRTDGMLMHCRDRSLELMRRVFASLQEAQQLSLVTSA